MQYILYNGLFYIAVLIWPVLAGYILIKDYSSLAGTGNLIKWVISFSVIVLGTIYFLFASAGLVKSPFVSDIYEALAISGVGSVISLIISFVICSIGAKQADALSITHGSARFANTEEEHEVLNDKYDGLMVDGTRRISQHQSFQNCLVVAPTGVGKTQSFVLPNLLGAGDYSMVVTDPSREVFAKTSYYLQSKGYNVLTIKPFDIANSCFYNPLENVKTLSDFRSKPLYYPP